MTERSATTKGVGPLGLGGQGMGPAVVSTALFALGLIATAVFFWNGIQELLTAWQLPEYSHGPLIPVLSFFLFLRQMRMNPEPAGPITDRWPGFLIALLALLFAAIGNFSQIDDIVAYGLIIWCGALVVLRFGWKHGAIYWPPVLHLVFMLPLPNFLAWKVTTSLQLVSSELGVAFVKLVGIPVFLEGNIIDLGVYSLHVAEACSGLRYLFPIMSFSYIFAVLYTGPTWHKAVLLLSAAPITIVMNSFRIGVVAVMVDAYGIEQAEGFMHFFEGWVIFLTCVLMLFGLAMLMQRMLPERKTLSEALDLDFDGLGGQMRRLISDRPSVPMMSTSVLVVALAGVWAAAPSNHVSPIGRAPLVLFPAQLGQWVSDAPQVLDPAIEEVLAADDYRLVNFRHPEAAAPVSFFTAYYDNLAGGEGIHSPEVCIPGAGWEMSEIEQVTISGSGETAVTVNRAVIQKGLQRQLVYFWFDQNGRKLTNDYVAKAYTMYDALTTGRTHGALVRLTTAILEDEEDAAAEARLNSFFEASKVELARYLTD